MALSSQPFLVLGISAVANCLVEGVSWLLVYRTPQFKRLKEELDRSSKKLEAARASSAKGKRNKKEIRLEENMKTTNRDLTATRMKTGFIMTALLFLLYNMVSTWFDGVVMAKLPFHPPGFMQRMTHMGVQGDDFTECGATFIYAMATVAIRTNLQKAMGWAPSRAAAKIGSAQNWMEQKLK